MSWADDDAGWSTGAVGAATGASQEKPKQEEVASSGQGGNDDNDNTQPQDTQQDTAVVDNLLEALHDVKVKLADKQADSTSPLYSAKTFEELGLDERLLKGIYAMRFKTPSKVQERALPLLLGNPPTNLVAQSQSGTGKTAAFTLAMLSRVDAGEGEGIQAVCLAPTRELARQIYNVVTEMGQFMSNVKVAMALREDQSGGGSSGRLAITDHILIGTPGTINDLDRKRLIDLSKVKIYVLDEADVMLDKQGMGIQSLRVRKSCPDTVQTVLFSATFTEEVIEFAHKIAPNANEISLKRNELSVDAIKQFYMDCHGYRHKFEILSALYGLLTIGQSIIFVATRNSAEEVQAHMEGEGHRTSLLHGGMSPDERDKIIDDFRLGKTKVLITTNVLARGIDILQVSLVVNFDLPYTVDRLPDPETYLHRIGRTGRFGRTGVAINLVSSRDNLECMLAFEKYFGKTITRIPTESIEAIEAKLSTIEQ
jgi:ATP-dependent RNA helicase DDX19/DBP5